MRNGTEMNGFVVSCAAMNGPVMNGHGKACFQCLSVSCNEWSCDKWSQKCLCLMADYSGVLLDLFSCFVLPACHGLLKVTFFDVEMVSIAAGVDVSLGTLNSMMPNISDSGYDNSIGGLMVSSNT